MVTNTPIYILKSHLEKLKNQKFFDNIKSENLQFLRSSYNFQQRSIQTINDAISVLEEKGFHA